MPYIIYERPGCQHCLAAKSDFKKQGKIYKTEFWDLLAIDEQEYWLAIMQENNQDDLPLIIEMINGKKEFVPHNY